MGWLSYYRAATPGVLLLDNATVILDAENEVQPDAALCVVEGGQTQIVGAYLHGAPELVVEIATSSAAYDLHEKLRVYRRAGVREYVILLTLERETLWYYLNEGRYEAVAPGEDGIVRSQVFPAFIFIRRNSGPMTCPGFWKLCRLD
jgi:Uma2 family endonuclease